MPRRSSITGGFRHASERDTDDPLSLALAPPEGETQEEAEIRIRAEKAAAKVSDDIDRQLRLEMQAAKRRNCVKVLLLGQSESGKSTVLKNFQRKYDPSAFDRERASWRSVCQLNVVRSFGIILDLLNHAAEAHERHNRHDAVDVNPLTPPRSPVGENIENDETPDSDAEIPEQQQEQQHQQRRKHLLTADHRRLIMRLAPLRQIEHELTRRFRSSWSSTPMHASLPVSPPHSPLSPSRSHQELHVSGYAWQRAREHRQNHLDSTALAKSGAAAAARGVDDSEDEELSRVLCACREDMMALWSDPIVRDVLKAQRVGMEELSSFFLDNLGRIAVPDFAPTDEDILRARLKTMGVTEHRFTIKSKLSDRETFSTADLRIYDVGGSRNQRPSWMPFFDDVNAIVFMAPMSAFDQTLNEAPDVNRLEDTFLLWKQICSSKLLVKVSLVLLLNKRDVLQRKLESGIRFGRYVKSYSGTNEWDSVAKYLKSKFKAVQRELSPVQRLFYGHVTCATDTTQMAVILVAIEDVVLRRSLENISLL